MIELVSALTNSQKQSIVWEDHELVAECRYRTGGMQAGDTQQTEQAGGKAR